MSAIIIKTDNKSNKILRELAKRLGADVVNIKDDQYEDVLFGSVIESEKTGKDVSRDDIFKKLKSK